MEQNAQNVDTIKRSKRNFHLIKPTYKYRAEVERQITAAGCRTRKDSVRMVEALITASPEVFDSMKRSEVKAYFEHALDFIKQKQDPSTIISAVVHMDEKTPHLHLCFVPLTPDGRLSAKEIIGNRKKLIQWQDEFWRHMVKKYPELERGESASQSGRDHIPPRVFKEMTHLTQQRKQLDQLLTGLTPFNLKARSAEIRKLLDGYIPAVEKMRTQLTKYRTAFTDTATENQQLKAENQTLTAALGKAQETSVLKQLQDAQLQREYEAAIQTLESIPPEVIAFYKNPPPAEHQKESR